MIPLSGRCSSIIDATLLTAHERRELISNVCSSWMCSPLLWRDTTPLRCHRPSTDPDLHLHPQCCAHHLNHYCPFSGYSWCELQHTQDCPSTTTQDCQHTNIPLEPLNEKILFFPSTPIFNIFFFFTLWKHTENHTCTCHCYTLLFSYTDPDHALRR